MITAPGSKIYVKFANVGPDSSLSSKWVIDFSTPFFIYHMFYFDFRRSKRSLRLRFRSRILLFPHMFYVRRLVSKLH